MSRHFRPSTPSSPLSPSDETASAEGGPTRRRLSFHVDTDAEKRARKAEKVVGIIQQLAPSPHRGLALDIGCGAGYISERLRALGWRTISLDVTDHRTIATADFLLGQAESLPFSSGLFSLVVSNHVIEHVRDAAVHLSEIRRVLAPGGLAYVATPNRLWIWEPHFKLPFLSWLPPKLADAYVRVLGRGPFYDVSPLTRGKLISHAARAGLTCQDIFHRAVGETGRVEGSWLARVISRLPGRVTQLLSAVGPTLVMVMWPVMAGEDNAQA